jgi:hypothetical protein
MPVPGMRLKGAALTDDDLDVESVNMEQRLAVLSNGVTVPVTKLFDEDGDETDDPCEADTFECGSELTGWFVCLMDDFLWDLKPH